MEAIALGLILGVTGSFHCIGMCGPIALALPISHKSSLSKTIGILSYNFGRVLTYSIIGILFGFFGKGFQLAGILQGVSIFLGTIILLSLILPRVLKKINFTSKYYLKLSNWVKQKIGARFQKKSNISLFVLGVLNGMLPCGLVFVAITSAIAQGGILEGGVFMLFFGMGTIPMMFLLPYFSGALSTTVRNKMRKAIPYIMAAFGILFILRGLNLGIPYLSPEFNKTGTEIKSCCHSSSTIKN